MSDHLAWQLGALSLSSAAHAAAELVIGNLDEDGYLAATEEELATALSQLRVVERASENGHHDLTSALELARNAIDLVQHLDPAGVGARDLRECLMIQVAAQQHEFSQLYAKRPVEAEEELHRGLKAEAEARLEDRRRAMEVAAQIVDRHLHLLQKRDLKDLARAAQLSVEEAHAGMEFIRTLDPRPGRLYNREQTRLD